MPEDLARFRAAIAAAREEADYLVVACHWGYSSWVEVLQSYELELARDAVDHGADAVVCHHHHSLRGIELRRGKPIFYGLGALVHHFESFETTRGGPSRARRRVSASARRWWRTRRSRCFPFRADARRTGIATLDVAPDGTAAAGFVPAMMLADGSTEPLRPRRPAGRRRRRLRRAALASEWLRRPGSPGRSATDRCCYSVKEGE